MTTDDPLIQQIRTARDQHAARFDYDLKAIFDDIRARQKASGRRYATFPPRRAAPANTKA